MEQRTLRLGDIVDDYCPRERRITNHAIVALVGQEIRQTRCATCDADHEYKGDRVLRKKPVKTPAEPVLAAGPAPEPAAPPPARLASDNGKTDDVEVPATAAPAGPSSNGEAKDVSLVAEPAAEEPWHDGWLAQRPLIRATLPRVEGGDPTPRPIPEFTMHQRQGRPPSHGFRSGQPPRDGFGNGTPPPRDGQPDGNRPRGGRRRRRRRPRA
jgi:hypothetical protein